jgi:hypothetical protein
VVASFTSAALAGRSAGGAAAGAFCPGSRPRPPKIPFMELSRFIAPGRGLRKHASAALRSKCGFGHKTATVNPHASITLAFRQDLN